MQTLKALFDGVVAYCVDVPFHAITLVLIVVLTLAAAGGLIYLYARSVSEKSLQQVLEQDENFAVHEAPPPDSPRKQAWKFEPDEEDAEDEEESDEEELPLPEITVRVKPIDKKKTSDKPKTAIKNKAAATRSRDAEIEKNNTVARKEEIMLLDELKDINTDLDFYEEDETDKMARYSGKWTVCRVVTNDSENLDLYFVELQSANGEKLLSSEEYTNYNAAVRGVETHKSNILRSNYRIRKTKSGDYTFKLLNGKGMLLCMGEVYATRAECEHALELAKRFARTAFIDENIQDVVVKVPEESDTPILVRDSGENGKWVIDCREVDGERIFYFLLVNSRGDVLLESEEYNSYVGAINSIQTHKTNIKNGNFRVILTKQGDYVYKLLNGNGQLLYLSDHYRTKAFCEYYVELLKRYATHSPVLTDSELAKEE